MKLALFLADGFEESEAVVTVGILRRTNILVDLITITNKLYVISSHKIILKVEKKIDDIKYAEYLGFILPGGENGVQNLLKCKKLKIILQQANKDKKIIAAICAAPQILGCWGFLNNKKATSYPGCIMGMEQSIYNDKLEVVIDDNIITGNSMGSTIVFALSIVKKILGENKTLSIKKQLIIKN